MHATTLFTTIAFAASIMASPAPLALSRRQGFPSFRLSSARTIGQTCVPPACIPQDYTNTVIESDCGGRDCNAPADGFTSGESLCDFEFEICGRTVTLVGRSDGDCRATKDLSEADYGTGYAVITENGQDVGACAANMRESGAQTCGLSSSTTFSALVDCTFD
ncbi:hypothetical protein BKA59DRAFT_458804 [Fusarium tricinctum]|uniref:Uncharacterized protein n=1 Tax=Fusarium tricinctum TaxID=61284 RepID=A0A8K0RSL1_9HYPO|nr:hypothetical protein BKA59DRAFT_458804 [Fusarium tricinctum]